METSETLCFWRSTLGDHIARRVPEESRLAMDEHDIEGEGSTEAASIIA